MNLDHLIRQTARRVSHLLWAVAACASLSAPLAVAQEAPARDDTAQRRVTLLAGMGNDLGGFGAQGELHVADERLSVFLGLGYLPDLDDNATGVTFAAGVRGFVGGKRHRAFLQANVSPIFVETGFQPTSILYGPGMMVGYQYTALGGFTILAGAGAGYAPGVDSERQSPWALIADIGFGYTWR